MPLIEGAAAEPASFISPLSRPPVRRRRAPRRGGARGRTAGGRPFSSYQTRSPRSIAPTRRFPAARSAFGGSQLTVESAGRGAGGRARDSRGRRGRGRARLSRPGRRRRRA
ncbi:MAG: hypothetical protein D6696_19245 [Acidobacteria bacterium]|nr:MAG: hypothetical protein D6696_19245 [Acidobacteriota bacterium]